MIKMLSNQPAIRVINACKFFSKTVKPSKPSIFASTRARLWACRTLDIAASISPQVQGDLAEIFDCRWHQAREQLSTWLQNLGIAPRDLRSSPAGLLQLQQALGSARGRNFVGNTA
jgi:hypothetical protein